MCVGFMDYLLQSIPVHPTDSQTGENEQGPRYGTPHGEAKFQNQFGSHAPAHSDAPKVESLHGNSITARSYSELSV